MILNDDDDVDNKTKIVSLKNDFNLIPVAVSFH